MRLTCKWLISVNWFSSVQVIRKIREVKNQAFKLFLNKQTIFIMNDCTRFLAFNYIKHCKDVIGMVRKWVALNCFEYWMGVVQLFPVITQWQDRLIKHSAFNFASFQNSCHNPLSPLSCLMFNKPRFNPENYLLKWAMLCKSKSLDHCGCHIKRRLKAVTSPAKSSFGVIPCYTYQFAGSSRIWLVNMLGSCYSCWNK